MHDTKKILGVSFFFLFLHFFSVDQIGYGKTHSTTYKNKTKKKRRVTQEKRKRTANAGGFFSSLFFTLGERRNVSRWTNLDSTKWGRKRTNLFSACFVDRTHATHTKSCSHPIFFSTVERVEAQLSQNRQTTPLPSFESEPHSDPSTAALGHHSHHPHTHSQICKN